MHLSYSMFRLEGECATLAGTAGMAPALRVSVTFGVPSWIPTDPIR
jgi:hypothetical protein